MSRRRDEALATLSRLGLDPQAIDDPTRLDAQLPALTEGDTVALLEALAELGGAAAASWLGRIAPGDAPGQKALRRARFRLAQRGVPVPAIVEPVPTTRTVAIGGPDLEGHLSSFDGRGDRLAWLLRPQSGGGWLLLAAEIHEPEGLRDVRITEIGRKELRALRDRLQHEARLRLVPADWAVVDALIVEAHERAGAPDRARDYLRLRPQMTSLPAIAPAEPRSPLASPPPPEEARALVASSEELLAIPEFQAWWPAAEAAQPVLDEIAAVRDSPLVLNPLQQEERLQAILLRAASTLYPPAVTARRLEGTAYVLAGTGRAPAARQALAVASALRAGVAAGDVPLLRSLVQQGIGARYAGEQSRREEERRGSLVVTPGEALTGRGSSRPGRTRG